jgi:hypothetical protein
MKSCRHVRLTFADDGHAKVCDPHFFSIGGVLQF